MSRPIREWAIDQEIKALIGKVVDGTITEAERTRFDMLNRERVRLMTPRRSPPNTLAERGR